MITIQLNGVPTSGNYMVEAPAVASPKGKVVILNGASTATKTAVLGALEPQLVDCKIQIVDSYIMTKPASSDLIERELRSVYIEQVLKSADQGHTILLTTCLLKDSEGRRDLKNILSIFRGKQVPLSWVDADFEPRDSGYGCSPVAEHSDTRLSPGMTRTIFPSRTRNDLEGIELVTRTFTAEHSTQEAVQELLYLMGLTR
ncbi:chloramphenicol phosphotransferase [Fusarium langsethiae]|uniref:Chloramphenicol phosphotransferase n=1 Tax=Fusarium langsethiae TaxID=179993 RepID=A0A0N0DDT9_FUSLA|nr:chloramphenicol phosphotransferase [Fusarium langsethiae]GKT99975.1 unnamed protein product [Fusarium langsethiae]GKU11984.1 unnamed protein product [Fusarium langsethiae]